MALFRELCARGDLDGVRAAVARGDDVNVGDQLRITGLMLALFRGHNNVVKFVLEEPSLHMNSSDRDGDTALHWAVKNGNVTGLRTLLGDPLTRDPRLTSVNSRNRWGWTPLMEAVAEGSVECARELVRVEGVDLDTWDDRGMSVEDMVR